VDQLITACWIGIAVLLLIFQWVVVWGFARLIRALDEVIKGLRSISETLESIKENLLP
jgi:hypothetical protein